jgi:ABC-type transport system substrate-binding protein
MSWVMISSPAQWEKVGKDWNKFAQTPSGTGPWKLASFVPHTSAELVPNKDYWDKARVPKLDKMILLPIPEASTRTAALRSGQVDWIETPAPDAVDSLNKAGFKLIDGPYPHNWTWHLSMVDGSPWKDIRVRKAANLAVDRDGLKVLLHGLMLPAKGFVTPSSPWFGHPKFDVKYDPAEAKKLLAEAGFSPAKPVSVKVLISSSGSGQMQPLPMNELVKSQLEAAGFEVSLQTMDWNALLDTYRAGVDKYPDFDGLNFSRGLLDPVNAIIKLVGKAYWAPKGSNWGHFESPETEALIDQIFNEFDGEKRLSLLTELHELEGKQAVMVFVVHDLNPRAMSPKVKGFIQAQSWFQDLTRVSVTP